MPRILALDLSLSCAGFAVIEIDNRKPILIHKSHVKTNAKQTHGQRLISIAEHLQWLHKKYGDFNAVVREKGFSMHASTTQALFKVVGVSDLIMATNGHPQIVEIPPTTVKKALTGNGRADKDEVANALKPYVGAQVYKVNDESDAVAVGIAYAIQKKLIGG